MRAPVRVLWLVKGLGRGGAEQLLVAVARELDPTLIDLHVGYVLPHKDALVGDLVATGATIHCLADAAGPWPVALGSLLRRSDFDLVHTHSPVVAAAARLLAPRRTALFHTEHNMWGRYRLPTRLANALTLPRNRTVWAVSEGVAESIPERARRRTPVVVLRHGLAPLDDERPVDRAEALAALGLGPGPFTVGTVGNLTAKKDQATLVAALAQLRATEPDARLVLVGGGPEEGHLRALVATCGLRDAVHFTGVRDDVPRILPAFDVFAMSSMYEGLSIALLEAMARKIPPVVTRVGGLPEVVRDGRDGLVVPPGDPTAMAEALSRLATRPDLRAELAARARVRSGYFGIGPAVRVLSDAYGLGRSPARAS